MFNRFLYLITSQLVVLKNIVQYSSFIHSTNIKWFFFSLGRWNLKQRLFEYYFLHYTWTSFTQMKYQFVKSSLPNTPTSCNKRYIQIYECVAYASKHNVNKCLQICSLRGAKRPTQKPYRSCFHPTTSELVSSVGHITISTSLSCIDCKFWSEILSYISAWSHF